MNPERTLRRRSPGYVREWSSAAIHGVAAKLNRDRQSADLSDDQEWLFDALVSELEYRRRQTRPVWRRCSCGLCTPPFLD